MLYSSVPGGGQLYNGHPVKALLFAGTFSYFSVALIQAQQNFNASPDDQDLHRKRNDQVWLMALTWTLNLIDAYVDAQFWDFDAYDIRDSDQTNVATESIKPTEDEHDE